MLKLIEKIRQHTLGNKEEAFSLYFTLCDCLKEKYGLVDRDYDENPTRRGKEWIDIHHIREYELDDIANRTNIARDLEKEIRNPSFENQIVIGLKSSEWNDAKMEEIRKQYPDKSVAFWGVDYTLEELKPYNVKEQLVYANKIEHFLLHYLITSAKGKKVFSGGPNYLWDSSVALDIYGFDKEYMNNLKNEKEKFYSVLSSEEITLLYKKLIDWKGWEDWRCSRYWMNFKTMLRNISNKEVSYVDDKEKFFELFNIIKYNLPKEIANEIITFPYKTKIIKWCGIDAKIINKNIYSIDEKTVLYFRGIFNNKSFTVPSNIERIASGAFLSCMEQITIPTTVKEMEDKVFTCQPSGVRRCPNLKKIYYKGTKQMWETNFSNVDLDGITLVCKK